MEEEEERGLIRYRKERLVQVSTMHLFSRSVNDELISVEIICQYELLAYRLGFWI